MDSANAQKILGYFIEEAKEHLETLEQGILDLGNLVNNNEQMNEMFRAVHSVKGGAAMLGYSSIQKTAHRLEDALKILKENPLE
ncbi:MAG: Hpt domain-containing protein, partial [Microcystis panniformis]